MSNVGRGHRFENKIKQDFITRGGYHVTRSAASKGDFDLIAVSPYKKKIILIEAKTYKLRGKERVAEELKSKKYNGTYEVEFLLVEKDITDLEKYF